MQRRIGIDARLWNETGVGRYIRNLVNHIARVDKKNRYILFLRKHEYDNIVLPGKNFEKRLADVHWHTVEEQMLLPRIINRQKLDLMHFPYFSVPIFYKNPFIVTIHDLILYHYPTGKASTKSAFVYYTKLFLYKYVIAHASSQAKKIIAVSEATKQEIVEHLHVPESKIAVTYEGVDETFTKSAIHKNNDRSEKSPYFLYVGNAYPHKNLELFIHAFHLFKQRYDTSVILLLIGRSDFFYTRLRSYITSLHMEKWVIIKNNVPDRELTNLYAHAEAVVVPSLMEGFGLPALEGMAHGALVLASDIASLHEICHDSVLYINPFDESSIADRLAFVYTHETNFSEKKKEAKKIAQSFSWEKMAKETVDIYESSIGIRSGK